MEHNPSTPDSTDVSALADALSSSALDTSSQASSQADSAPQASPRPLRIYTRAQLLSLHDSPLVKPPPNMPELKHWFGTENEQNLSKKDTDTLVSNTRDRRFRREYDDGDNPGRASFRSTLSQPSQMGNFKHQSLRDRDKDRDDKDRDRDARDKDGHERLRHLSDKYDRDRLGLAAANARNRERESGLSPTTTTTTTTRTAQPSTNSTSSRRNEGRDASKRKGEGGDDWRRDVPRSGREERNDNPRKEREERARSRQRDASRSRTETSRRERAGEEDDDSRHWRDDGKRDDRLASRRTRDKQGGDHWEPSNDRERRWPANEERDGRTKRTNGRDRRTGADDLKDREDRRDREKEKEPAWMDSSVPSEPLPGILGGKASNGELDGIQAWKKGMKDKEKQEKEKAVADTSPPEQAAESQHTSSAPQMDEIQLFRLMMQKEQGKLGGDQSADASPRAKPSEGSLPGPALDQGLKAAGSSQDPLKPSTAAPAALVSPPLGHADGAPGNSQFVPPPGSRLLALGRGSGKPTPAAEIPVQAPAPLAASSLPNVPSGRSQPSRGSSSLTPFEEQVNQFQPHMDGLGGLAGINSLEAQQRLHLDRSPVNPQYAHAQDHLMIDLNSNGHNAKGSRFAKFFDPKSREPPALSAKSQSPIGFLSQSPGLGQRPDHTPYNAPPSNHESKNTMDDIYAMLRESQSGHNPNANLGHLPMPQQNAGYNGHSNLQPMHPQHHASRIESLYDSRLDDRSFVPNDMVPGLRTFPPPRNREAYSESIVDPILHLQRLSQQQHQLPLRGEPSFNGPINTLYNQPLPQRSLPNQPQFRGNPGSNAAHPLMQNQNPQRFPPGLANLGNRPPHEPSQFIGLGGGNGPVGGMGNSVPVPQQFNNFPNNNPQFNAQQFRGGIPPINLQGLQQSASPLSMNNVGQPNIDPRLSNQHFVTGLGGGQRLPNNLPGQRMPPHPQLNLRGPQQQQVHPQLLGHMQGPTNPPQQHMNQPAQDLMALLLGGSIRD
ncbi:hypothetical protein BKA70DRAFT_1251668 [Coprinopsis sp. MPI-PUGE-AT-0042]|nr:hypothetical protein BKA70DRAFT_1251668 [Coprinopsis sp. MPI-PUGE-AT-0042]